MNYQIFRTNTTESNFNLKYKVFSWIEGDRETNLENSIFLKHEGLEFIKYAGNLKLDEQDISDLLNSYFDNYRPNKKLINPLNIKL